ncbi:MAG: HAD-IIIA family hydrolase, partial [Magnetococcales bacterium]|nr:HAD-IIIA family hydrolase [Magnetococcales bacterium]
HLADNSGPYPGVESTLDKLIDTGFTLAVVTNKPIRLTHKLLDQLDLARRFKSVIGGDSTPYRKPDPQSIQLALKELNVTATQAVMVGDSSADIDGAKNAECASIGVSYGYSRGVAIEDLKPSRVIDHFDQIIDIVQFLQD